MIYLSIVDAESLEDGKAKAADKGKYFFKFNLKNDSFV